MYRTKLDQENKQALIDCFSEDFGNLNDDEQQLMRDELMQEMKRCKNQISSATGKKRAKLEKDLEFFSLLAKELGMDSVDTMDSESIKEDLEMINRALQKGTDDPLRKIEKSDFTSQIAQQKYEEFDEAMKAQSRWVYSRSTLLQQLGDYLKGTLSGNKEGTNQTKETDLELTDSSESVSFLEATDEKNVQETVAEFSDSDFWVSFAKFCEEYGITRADRKAIPWRWGMDTTLQYIDKEGNPLRLKYLAGWAEQHDDMWAATNYVLVRETKQEPKQDSKEESKGEVKQEPKEEAKEEIKQDPEPQPNPQPELKEIPEDKDVEKAYSFDLSASLSEMRTIHEENARYEAEVALRNDYHQVNKWNVFKKAALFFQRGKNRKKMIDELMKKNEHLPFTDDEKLNASLAHATNRHEIEHHLGVGAIEGTEIVAIPEVNQLAQEYILGNLEDSIFESRFNELLKNNESLSASVKDISHLGTNILQKLKIEKAQYQLVSELAQALEDGATTDQVQTKIEQFLKEYQKSPDFLKDIQADLNEKDLEKLKRYFKHQRALRAMALKNLKMKLSVFTGGKFAYQIDNTDREKGRVNKLGKKLDKIPWYVQVPGYMGLWAVLGLAGGPLGLGVVWTSILTTTTFAGTTGFMNFVKKWTHYTKEQNTHEKDLTRNYNEQQKLIQQWKDTMKKKGAKNWFSRHHAKRQLELYDQTTQKNMVKTQEVTKDLLAFATSLRTLSESEKGQLLAFVMGAKARLQAYRETGHNFLASNSREEVESDMDQLYQALILAAEKLGFTFEEIDQQKLQNAESREVSYQDLVKELYEDYASSAKTFRKQRAVLATKYGIGTAAVSAGTAVGLQALMGTGMFASEATVQHSEIARQMATSDQFWLWSHELANGNQIQTSIAEQVRGLTDSWDRLVIHYGSGTDATLVKAGSLLNDPSTYQAKLEAVADQIKNLNLTSGQKSAFLDELSKRSWEADWSKAFTNDYLQGDRCAEGILQIAKGLEASGNTGLVPEFSYDAIKSVAGTALHNSGERLFSAGMQITDATMSEVAWTGSTWRVPITGFFNTFKDAKIQEENYDQKGEKSDSSAETIGDPIKSQLWRPIVIPSWHFDSPNTWPSDSPSTWEKIKKSARTFWEKTKEKASEFKDKFQEKYHEKAPIIKEKSKQAWEKTKETGKKLTSVTAARVKSLKSELFDEDEWEDNLDDFDRLKKTAETEKLLDYKGYKMEEDESWLVKNIKTEVFKPRTVVNYQGKKVYLTGKINDHYVVAYLEQEWELIPRVFRRSESGGNWHAVPWYDGARVSKWEFVPNISYEKWTVVKRDFNQILDDEVQNEGLQVNAMALVMEDVYGKDIPRSAYREIGQHYNDLPKAAQEYSDETVVFDELLGEWNPNKTRDPVFNGYQSADQVKEYYDKLSLEKKMDFSDSEIVNTYTTNHNYLGEVENQVMTARVKSQNPEFDGREIQITVATAKSDWLSRVENIVFSQDEGTSFFTQKNPISGGLLTTKPLDYESQVPAFILADSQVRYGNYVDLRPYMQNNPLIKQWRKLQ